MMMMRLNRRQFEVVLLLLLEIFVLLELGECKTADQKDFPACSSNHHPQYYCCNHGNGEKYVMTKYRLPQGNPSYAKEYREGWLENERQVNFPDSVYTPNSPSFHYNSPQEVCRLKRSLSSKGQLIEILQCGEKDNVTLAAASSDPTVFFTTTKNPRNNNATCPDGAELTEIFTLHQRQACVSSLTSEDSYYHSFMDTPFVIVYCIYGFGLLLCLFWTLYKYNLEYRPSHFSKVHHSPAFGGGRFGKLSPCEDVEEGEEDLEVASLTNTRRFSSSLNYCNDEMTRVEKQPQSTTCTITTPKQNVLLSCKSGPRTPCTYSGLSKSVSYVGIPDQEVPVTPFTSSMKKKNKKRNMKNTEERDPIDQSGYDSNAIGNWILYYLVFLTLFFNVLFVVIIMDYYVLFGQPMLPRGEKILITFMCVFFIAIGWYMSIVYLQKKVLNYFRFKAPLDSCQYLCLRKSEETEVMLLDKSGVSDFVGKIESYLRGGKQAHGAGDTLAIHFTKEGTRYVDFQHIRYIYDRTEEKFISSCIEIGKTFGEMHQQAHGLSTKEYQSRFDLLGPNAIDIKMPSIGNSLVTEFFNFFYIYQIFCYYVWIYYSYWYMAMIMLSIIAVSASINIIIKRQMQYAVTEISKYSSTVMVKRDLEWIEISTNYLVPGDLIQVKEDWILPCDLILIQGATVCDESNLTGESMPVQKIAIPFHTTTTTGTTTTTTTTSSSTTSTTTSLKKHALLAGTKVLASGRKPHQPVLALVQLTGAHTSKGQLLRNILFPVKMRFKYDEHLKVLLFFLFIYWIIATYFVIYFLSSNGNLTNRLNAFGYIVFMLTGIMSPLLPVVITVGQVVASKRLEKLGTFCLNSSRLALAGKVRVFCFDKTGTLTKQGLDFLGCKQVCTTTNSTTLLNLSSIPGSIPGSTAGSTPSSTPGSTAGSTSGSTAGSTAGSCRIPSCNFNPTTISRICDENLGQDLIAALASCHSVGSLNGTLVGNQVEVKMFTATGWRLIEKSGEKPIVESAYGRRLQVLKRFEFEHHRMSMSVVMKDLDSHKLYAFCKGSYEKIKSLSLPHTLPDDYEQVSEGLAKEGCYLLAIAFKVLPLDADFSEQQLEECMKDRDSIESEMNLLGLVMFRNELKDDSFYSIQQLKQGDTRPVMITGDNALCGCHIARQCGMIQQDIPVLLADLDTTQQLTWTNIDTKQQFSIEYILQHLKPSSNDNHIDDNNNFDNLTNEFELAVTGKAFNYLIANGKMETLLFHTRIFSRMTPEDKVKCVEMHMNQGAVTGMCGDGGNDCGALRIAHVGIALSEAEASIVSPFTSKTKTVASVVDLCKEGRCSLATSFASVKFLIMYGLICSTLRFVQYYHGVIIAEWCWIIADGFVSIGLSYFITTSYPLQNLGNQRPTSSLIGPTTLLSILGQEAINVCFLALSLSYLIQQPWYCPFVPSNVDLAKWWLLSDNAISTCLFYTIIFQQLTAALVFSFGGRFRQPVWSNTGLCIFYTLLFILEIYLVVGEPSALTDLFRIASSTNVVGLPDIPLPKNFRIAYLMFILANMACTIFYEYFFIIGPIRDLLRNKFHKDHLNIQV